jgi:hypothetical protein
MSEAAVLEAPKTHAKLVFPREESIAHIQTQLRKGMEIKALRIRNGGELDAARTQKLEWSNATTDLLNQMFDGPAVAEQVNDWVGRIYPEYAEFGNFVEQFYAEMDHRLRRLKAVLKQIQKIPLETRASSPAAPVNSAPLTGAVPTAAVQVPQAPQASAAPAAPLIGRILEQPTLTVNALVLSFGADESIRNAVAEFLGTLDVNVTLVDDATPGGIITGIDQVRDASFALVLRGQNQPDRNFELGFAAGRLGMTRICLMHSENTPAAQDSRGFTQIAMDPNNGWQLVLARQLKRSGLDIDLNRLC